MAVTRRGLALTTAHQRAQREIQLRTARAVASAWRQYAAIDDAEPFVRRAVPIVATARRAAANLAANYTRTFATSDAGIALPAFGVPDATLDELRGGTPLDVVYERGIITARSQLADGALWDDAMSTGLARSEQAARTDAALGARAGLVVGALALARHYGRSRAPKWTRVAGGPCCAFCDMAHGTIYDSPDGMPLHPGCDCTVEPLLGTDRYSEDPGPVEDSPGQVAAADDGTAEFEIHQHGELGPVPYPAGQKFTDI